MHAGRRNQRLMAGIVAILLAAGVCWAVLSQRKSQSTARARQPVPNNGPAPSKSPPPGGTCVKNPGDSGIARHPDDPVSSGEPVNSAESSKRAIESARRLNKLRKFLEQGSEKMLEEKRKGTLYMGTIENALRDAPEEATRMVVDSLNDPSFSFEAKRLILNHIGDFPPACWVRAALGQVLEFTDKDMRLLWCNSLGLCWNEAISEQSDLLHKAYSLIMYDSDPNLVLALVDKIQGWPAEQMCFSQAFQNRLLSEREPALRSDLAYTLAKYGSESDKLFIASVVLDEQRDGYLRYQAYWALETCILRVNKDTYETEREKYLKVLDPLFEEWIQNADGPLDPAEADMAIAAIQRLVRKREPAFAAKLLEIACTAAANPRVRGAAISNLTGYVPAAGTLSPEVETAILQLMTDETNDWNIRIESLGMLMLYGNESSWPQIEKLRSSPKLPSWYKEQTIQSYLRGADEAFREKVKKKKLGRRPCAIGF